MRMSASAQREHEEEEEEKGINRLLQTAVGI